MFRDGDAFLQHFSRNAFRDEPGVYANRPHLGERDLRAAIGGTEQRRPVIRHQSVPIRGTRGAPDRLSASRKRTRVVDRRFADDDELARRFVQAAALRPASQLSTHP